MTMKACDRGLHGGRDRGVDLLSGHKGIKNPADKTGTIPERVGAPITCTDTNTHKHKYLNTCEGSQ